MSLLGGSPQGGTAVDETHETHHGKGLCAECFCVLMLVC